MVKVNGGRNGWKSQDVVGEGVEGWTVGQRVGIGFLGGACGYCEYCRDGDLVNCVNQGYTGGAARRRLRRDDDRQGQRTDRGAGRSLGRRRRAAAVRRAHYFQRAAKLAGARRRPVAVFGVGGLGHLGVQYARRMGFEVVAIDRGDDRAELSKKLGAHHYIDSSATDVAKALQERGGAQVVAGHRLGRQGGRRRLGGLRRGGLVISLGASDEPIELSAFELLFKQLGVDGALTGTPKAGDATLSSAP